MTAVTLATLRTRVRERADMPTAGFVPDSATGIDAFINEGIQILHDKLVRAYESSYVESSASFTVGAAGVVSLPSDFYKLLSVELNSSDGGVVNVLPFKRNERASLSSIGVLNVTTPRYRIIAGTLQFEPATPLVGRTGTIRYFPQATTLVNTSDTVNFPAGWERWVVVYAAIQCLIKEESDTAPLERALAVMDRQIDEMVQNRDAGNSNHAIDVEVTEWDWWL